MACPVCAAPEVVREGACVFCRSPLAGTGAPPPGDLLAYLGRRVPGARARRAWLGLGPVRRLQVRAGGTAYRATWRRGGLRLEPAIGLGEWLESLLAALGRESVADAAVRSALSRAGWAIRR